MDLPLTDDLRQEYQQLFDTMLISPLHAVQVEKTTDAVAASQARYEAVGDPLGIPWFFIGAIHSLESGLDFTTHLHNGDPLTARTVHVPKGRPAKGKPPFQWEASAADALTLEGFADLDDWHLTTILYRFEKYNGFGYRPHHINSPYLWSFSNQYTAGKFAEDGKFSAVLVSQQCGAAVLVRRLAERGIIHFDSANNPVSDAPKDKPLVVYAPNVESAEAARLQAALNQFPGVSLAVDGFAGKRTSDALHRVIGAFLKGDPRG
jgi:lysozyme family protein